VNAKLEQFFNKIDTLTLRERVLLLVALLVVIFTAWDQLLMIPLQEERRQILSQIENTTTNLDKLNTQIQVMSQTLQQNQEEEQRARLARLSTDIEQLDRQIAELAGQLIPAEEMAKILEQMLTHDGQLSLTHVENLPPVPLLSEAEQQSEQTVKAQGESKDSANATPTPPPASAPAIYRHSVVIKFEGGFMETLDYIKQLEDLPQLFFWDRIEYSVDEFPKAKISITVSTLSFQEGWIGV
jgi:MSHA biogenesis protein MshJ